MEQAGALITQIKTYSSNRHDRQREALVAGLSEMGLKVNPTTLSRIKSGNTSGIKTLRSIHAVSLLKKDDIRKKLKTYRRISEALVESRESSGIDPKRYSSRSYTKRVAQALGISNVQDLRRLIRSMRTDLVASTQTNEAEELEAQVSLAFSDFFDTYSRPPSKRTRAYEKLQAALENGVADFYREVYRHGGPTIGMLVPFEAEIYEYLYNHQPGLTPFDKRVLRITTLVGHKMPAIQDVRRDFIVPIDKNIIMIHGAVLLGEFQLPAINEAQIVRR